MQIHQLNTVCSKQSYKIGVDDYTKGSWLHNFSEGFTKRYPSIRIVNHYLHAGIKEIIKIERDGFEDIVYPCWKGKLHENDFDLYSGSFVENIKNIDNEVIINHRPFTFISLYISKFMIDKPYIVQTHGEGTPNMSNEFDRNIRTYILSMYSKKLFEPIKYYLAGSTFELESIKNKYKFPRKLFKGGIDFNSFNPFDSHKDTRKIILNNKFNIVYIGKFYKSKGLDILINTMTKIKKTHSNFSFVCIGGSQSDELYNEVNKVADYIFPRLPNHQTINILRECDLYILPTPNYGKVYYTGGIGTAPIEAMALNIPVVSNNLVHFANKMEIEKVGEIPGLNLLESILRMYERIGFYNTVRETAARYYDNSVVYSNYLEAITTVLKGKNVNS